MFFHILAPTYLEDHRVVLKKNCERKRLLLTDLRVEYLKDH